MAKQLSYQPLPNFGLNGLNTQNNSSTLDSSWLTFADNIVLRESGRISFRKGLKQKVVPSGTAIGSIVEHNDQGTDKIFASHGTSIYTMDFTTPNAAFPSSGADVKHTVANSTGDWQFVNFNNRLHCFHTGIVPQRYDGALSSGSRWAAFVNGDRPPTVTTAEFKPSCAAGFYGRMWVGGVEEEKDVLHYSALLDSDDFTTSSGGGSFDLKKVWGKDDIIAIAPFYGMLAIFGRNNIVLYESPHIVGSMKLNEVIRGVGCIARDSVQNIGDDLVFLSATGLRSLARTSEKDKVPLLDISQNIKDTLIRNIGQSTNIKSVYVENEGIYIMSFVDKNINYVFDFKHFTPNKVPRVTTWTFDSDREPASLTYTRKFSGLLVGQKDGSIAGYEGYFDTDLAWVSSAASYTNSPFTSDVTSVWLTLGESVSSALLKRMILVLEGGSGATLGLKWYKDFSSTPSTTTSINLRPATTGSTALWGASTALYGATTVSHTHDAAVHPASSKYTPIYGLREYKTPLTGSAKHLKIAISIESNGYDTSIQDLTLLHKEGKIR